MRHLTPPGAILFDFGGTLVEELSYDVPAGVELLLRNLTYRPRSLRIEDVLERAARVQREVGARRDEFQIETPWPALTRLIYDYFGVHFALAFDDLELMFWDAIAHIRPMPGARDALVALGELGIPLGVVSNSSFRGDVIRHELAKHDLAEPVSAIIASADYAVRKPSPLLFETAAAILEVSPKDVWFVGDRLEVDVVGARAAGMAAVWYCPANDGPGDEADLIVTSFPALVAAASAML